MAAVAAAHGDAPRRRPPRKIRKPSPAQLAKQMAFKPASASHGPPARQSAAPNTVHAIEDDELRASSASNANHRSCADLSMIDRWMRASPENEAAKCKAT
jgi:hypothetical protein